MSAVAGHIELDAGVCMAYQLQANALLSRAGLPPLRGRYQLTEARDALVAGESAESFVARFVARETALCTCGHEYRAHGNITHACLTKVGGRWEGASDSVRCGCKRFRAAGAQRA